MVPMHVPYVDQFPFPQLVNFEFERGRRPLAAAQDLHCRLDASMGAFRHPQAAHGPYLHVQELQHHLDQRPFGDEVACPEEHASALVAGQLSCEQRPSVDADALVSSYRRSYAEGGWTHAWMVFARAASAAVRHSYLGDHAQAEHRPGGLALSLATACPAAAAVAVAVAASVVAVVGGVA